MHEKRPKPAGKAFINSGRIFPRRVSRRRMFTFNPMESSSHRLRSLLDLRQILIAAHPRRYDVLPSPEEPLRTIDSKDTDLNIDSLPNEMLTKIFEYLTQKELGQVASVCKKWNECTGNPALWKTIDVKILWIGGSQDEAVVLFSKKLSSSVTYIKLDFKYRYYWNTKLNFEKFIVTLKERCPSLDTLILYNALLSVNIFSVLNFCSKFLPNLKVLMFQYSDFQGNCEEREYNGLPKIKVFDIYRSHNVERSIINSFSKMPCLTKLNLAHTCDFSINEVSTSFLCQLEWLNLGGTYVDSNAFRLIRNHAVNLVEIFLCFTKVNDDDFQFSQPVFPFLRTICLTHCINVTCEAIVSLVQACESLENAYVGTHVAESYKKHPFVIDNACKLGIVKRIKKCDHEIVLFP